MKCIVSYDLHKARDYRALIAQLEAWDARRALESLWLVEVNGTPIEVRNALMRTVDADDSIFVVEIQAGAGWAVSNAHTARLWLAGRVLAE